MQALAQKLRPYFAADGEAEAALKQLALRATLARSFGTKIPDVLLVENNPALSSRNGINDGEDDPDERDSSRRRNLKRKRAQNDDDDVSSGAPDEKRVRVDVDLTQALEIRRKAIKDAHVNTTVNGVQLPPEIVADLLSALFTLDLDPEDVKAKHFIRPLTIDGVTVYLSTQGAQYFKEMVLLAASLLEYPTGFFLMFYSMGGSRQNYSYTLYNGLYGSETNTSLRVFTGYLHRYYIETANNTAQIRPTWTEWNALEPNFSDRHYLIKTWLVFTSPDTRVAPELQKFQDSAQELDKKIQDLAGANYTERIQFTGSSQIEPVALNYVASLGLAQAALFEAFSDYFLLEDSFGACKVSGLYFRNRAEYYSTPVSQWGLGVAAEVLAFRTDLLRINYDSIWQLSLDGFVRRGTDVSLWTLSATVGSMWPVLVCSTMTLDMVDQIDESDVVDAAIWSNLFNYAFASKQLISNPTDAAKSVQPFSKSTYFAWLNNSQQSPHLVAVPIIDFASTLNRPSASIQDQEAVTVALQTTKVTSNSIANVFDNVFLLLQKCMLDWIESPDIYSNPSYGNCLRAAAILQTALLPTPAVTETSEGKVNERLPRHIEQPVIVRDGVADPVNGMKFSSILQALINETDLSNGLGPFETLRVLRCFANYANRARLVVPSAFLAAVQTVAGLPSYACPSVKVEMYSPALHRFNALVRSTPGLMKLWQRVFFERWYLRPFDCILRLFQSELPAFSSAANRIPVAVDVRDAASFSRPIWLRDKNISKYVQYNFNQSGATASLFVPESFGNPSTPTVPLFALGIGTQTGLVVQIENKQPAFAYPSAAMQFLVNYARFHALSTRVLDYVGSHPSLSQCSVAIYTDNTLAEQFAAAVKEWGARRANLGVPRHAKLFPGHDLGPNKFPSDELDQIVAALYGLCVLGIHQLNVIHGAYPIVVTDNEESLFDILNSLNVAYQDNSDAAYPTFLLDWVRLYQLKGNAALNLFLKALNCLTSSHWVRLHPLQKDNVVKYEYTKGFSADYTARMMRKIDQIIFGITKMFRVEYNDYEGLYEIAFSDIDKCRVSVDVVSDITQIQVEVYNQTEWYMPFLHRFAELLKKHANDVGVHSVKFSIAVPKRDAVTSKDQADFVKSLVYLGYVPTEVDPDFMVSVQPYIVQELQKLTIVGGQIAVPPPLPGLKVGNVAPDAISRQLDRTREYTRVANNAVNQFIARLLSSTEPDTVELLYTTPHRLQVVNTVSPTLASKVYKWQRLLETDFGVAVSDRVLPSMTYFKTTMKTLPVWAVEVTPDKLGVKLVAGLPAPYDNTEKEIVPVTRHASSLFLSGGYYSDISTKQHAGTFYYWEPASNVYLVPTNPFRVPKFYTKLEAALALGDFDAGEFAARFLHLPVPPEDFVRAYTEAKKKHDQELRSKTRTVLAEIKTAIACVPASGDSIYNRVDSYKLELGAIYLFSNKKVDVVYRADFSPSSTYRTMLNDVNLDYIAKQYNADTKIQQAFSTKDTNTMALYATEDDLDQILATVFAEIGVDLVIFTHMAGSHRFVSEVLDTRNRSVSYDSLVSLSDV